MSEPTAPKPSNPRGGRPKLSPDQARSERLVTLLTLSEKAQIEAAAASLGLSLSDFARGALLSAEGRPPVAAAVPDAALAALGRAVVAMRPLAQALHPLNNNMNQIARYLHTDRNVTHWLDEERAQLAALTERLRHAVEQAEAAIKEVTTW